jgi:hypothetical protein
LYRCVFVFTMQRAQPIVGPMIGPTISPTIGLHRSEGKVLVALRRLHRYSRSETVTRSLFKMIAFLGGAAL